MTEVVEGESRDFVVYCFNSDKHWPSDSQNNAMDELFVPDEMIHLSEEVKDKLYRIMYAGYPEDNLGLIEAAGETYHDYQWINDHAVTPGAYVLDLFPALVGLDLTLKETEDGVRSIHSMEYAALAEVAETLNSWSFSDDDAEVARYEEFLSRELEFFAFTDAIYWTVGQGMPELFNIELWFDGYFNHHGHYATQVAIWRILYENGVPGNSKDQAQDMNGDTLVKQLVDFANGKGPYASVKVPPRTTTYTQMQSYRDNFFENGAVLLRADNTAVGKNGIIAFTLQADGTYVSEPLHFDTATTYEMPYHFSMSNGGSLKDEVVQHGEGDTFTLVADTLTEDTTATITVALDARWPSEVYQYVRESEKNKPVAERDTQEMSGCFFHTVPMELTLKATVVKDDPVPPPPVPPTGDSTPVAILAAVCMLSLMGLALLSRKKH